MNSLFRSITSALAVSTLLVAIHAFGADWPADVVMSNLRPNARALTGNDFSGWNVYESPLLEQAVLAFGPPMAVDDALACVLAAAGTHPDLQWIKSHSGRGLTRSVFIERRAGLPVLGSQAQIVLNQQQRLMRWTLRTYAEWPAPDRHALDLATAARSLVQGLEPAAWVVNDENSFPAWFPDLEKHMLRAVCWITVTGPQPHQRWQGIVDALTGEVILDWPGIVTDRLSGTVQGPYWQPYDHSEVQIAPHPFETIILNGSAFATNAQGEFSAEAGSVADLSTMLRGPYVLVWNDDLPEEEQSLIALQLNAPYSPLTWEWTTDDATRPELNLYHHTMFIHQWYKRLDPDFVALDYPLPAVANVGSGYDNAYWDGYGTYYGSGSMYGNFAMYSDVIYHEYTHGVTDGIYPDDMLPYTGQPGALNEAWSDYIGCSINGDPLMGEWLSGSPHSYFRNLENELVFPYHWQGEVHADSRFVSGALWRIRTAIGVGYTDTLCHYARYGLAETFLDYLVAVLETDDDDGDLSNGTPHGGVIYDAFGHHGIGPGSDPHFTIQNMTHVADGTNGSVGDGDRFVEPGETVALSFDLVNDAPLYPPPARNVHIVVSTVDPNITVQNGDHTIAELPAGQSYRVSSVLLPVNGGSPAHWAVIHVDITANDGDVSHHDSLEFTVGTPHVLIVEDDPNTDVEHYVLGALRANDRIYETLHLSAGESLPIDRYPRPGMIIWLSGDASGSILTTQDQTQVESYLAGGNRIVLTGQNIVDALAGSHFARDVLQVEIETDSLSSHAVTAAGAPFTPNEWFLITGSGGAANQHEPSAFTPTGSTRAIAYYGRSVGGLVAGVEFAEGRGLLFGFGIEAISGRIPGSTTLGTFLDELHVWAADVMAIESRPDVRVLPTEWALGPAFPNPFNASTRLRYSVPMGFAAELIVYDVLGRTVESRSLPVGVGTVTWAPRAGSGVYFAVMKWHGGQTEPVKLLLLR